MGLPAAMIVPILATDDIDLHYIAYIYIYIYEYIYIYMYIYIYAYTDMCSQQNDLSQWFLRPVI